ncbi:sensor domain-containing diguanylate cyclase [Alteromonas oceanisediminis]|uniref:sensor domain-containing diguanylate cyclase n=1 Tax=Alteromonas oceanisediminis TaxID=2836180 RepID=UPI001BD9FEA1|nr:diguanylate cyclase [Alteromonas oceanisediminis]MBT0586040.1 diguanylate cyclase [Alteromonas oceanisediminis]
MPDKAANSGVERWNLGIISAFLLVVIWGIVFLSLLDKQDQRISDIVHYVDRAGQASVADLRRLDAIEWAPLGEDSSLGMMQPAVWFKFTIPAPRANENRLLEIDYPLLDSLEIWLFTDDVNNRSAVRQYQLGDTLPFAQRPIQHPLFLIPLEGIEDEVTAYVKVQTSGTVRLPVSVWELNQYLEYSVLHASILVLFFGFMVAMAISNLFFYVTTRSLSFLVYTGYVVCLGITLATLHGQAFQYFWPHSTWIQSRAVVVFASITLVFAVVFSYQTLDIRKYSRKLAKLLQIAAATFGVFTFVSLFAPYAIMIKLFMAMLLLAVGSILACGMWLSFQGSQVARYYTLAWSFLLLSAFSATLDNLDIVSLPVSSHYILIFGASVETMLLGLILAMRYSQQRDSLSAAQTRALEKEQEATKVKDELIELQQKSQAELEYNVEERTLELEIALRELSEVNQELEKLSALDQLTGLPNRRQFDKRLLAESRRSRREQTELAIAMIDIDHFKRVNDQYGHIGGDRCLQVISEALSSALKRPLDEVFRYGGEEFSFILPNTDLDGALALLEEIRINVETITIESDEHRFTVTLSAGVTAGIPSFEGAEVDMIKFADELLYRAKEQGRNRVICAPMPAEKEILP